MWRHAHDDEGAKAHSLAIVNVSDSNILTSLKTYSIAVSKYYGTMSIKKCMYTCTFLGCRAMTRKAFDLQDQDEVPYHLLMVSDVFTILALTVPARVSR